MDAILPGVVQVFGLQAQQYGACLPQDLPCIIADASAPEIALAGAAQRRSAGERFFVGIVLDDAKSALAREGAQLLFRQVSGYGDRRNLLGEMANGRLNLNGRPLFDYQLVAEPKVRTLRDLMLLGDGLVVRSHAERLALHTLFGRTREHIIRIPGTDERIPEVRGDGQAIVIWAPDLPGRAVAIPAFACEELHAPLFVICADGEQIPGLRAKSVLPADSPAILERAQVIIDASLRGPGAALRFTELGFCVIASARSGAHEFISGIELYNHWDWQSILSAVSKAPGTRGWVISRGDIEVYRELYTSSAPRIEAEGPLVSVLVPTFNRRERLEKQLASLSAQTYPHLEIVVANDAGEAVDDIVARFPKARLVNCATNGGSGRATNAALEEARGEYFCVIADDDRFYSDHVARMVEAAVCTQAPILHANILQRLLDKTANGYAIRGFMFHYDQHLDYSATLAVVSVSVQGMFFKRDLFSNERFYDEDIPLAGDSELVIRLSRRYDFVHVDYAAGEWLCPHDQSAQSSANPRRLVEEVAIMFDRYPVSEEWLKQTRVQSLEGLSRMFGGGAGFEPAIRLPHGFAEIQ